MTERKRHRYLYYAVTTKDGVLSATSEKKFQILLGGVKRKDIIFCCRGVALDFEVKQIVNLVKN